MVQRTKLAMCWMQASQQNALCVSGHITHHSPWNSHTSFATLLINVNSEVKNESIRLKRALQWNPAQMPGHMNQQTLFDASESQAIRITLNWLEKIHSCVHLNSADGTKCHGIHVTDRSSADCHATNTPECCEEGKWEGPQPLILNWTMTSAVLHT